MILSSEHIRGRLKQQWPDLSQIWLTDPFYESMPWEWVQKAIDECSLKSLDFSSNVWDCDNYALLFHAKVQKFQYDLIKSGELKTKYSWALGECIGLNDNIFSGIGVHAQNLVISDKIYLIEPQDGTIMSPDKSYRPFFVKF